MCIEGMLILDISVCYPTEIENKVKIFTQISRFSYFNSKKSVLMYALLIILLNNIICFEAKPWLQFLVTLI